MPRIRANDVELHYDEAGSGDEPLVLIHGWIISRRDWCETIPRLPLDRYRVYAFDLRGVGLSDRPASGYTVEQYADDVIAALTALGVESFHCVGHSMGGLVAILLALRYPARLRKLVLVAPAASGGLPAPEALAPLMAACRDAGRCRAFFDLVSDGPLPEHLANIRVEDATTCSRGHVEGTIESMAGLNLTERLKEITAPTLMVVGDRDGLRPFNLADAARIPNCALHVFYRANHWIPWHEPQAFAELLADFLEHGTAAPINWEQRVAQMRAIAGA
jgi:pimeloyl-ACP methyl ester carboxylesterase